MGLFADTASIILAGGRGRRLGGNKATVELCGRPMIQYVVDSLAQLTDTIIIVGYTLGEAARIAAIVDWGGVTHTVLARDPKLPQAFDEERSHQRAGPLAGIRAGLTASPVDRCIVVGCDMPFLSLPLLAYMVEKSPNFDAVVPRLGPVAAFEPLCAVYSNSCIPAIDLLLSYGPTKTTRLFEMVNTAYVERELCESLDPQGLCFFNVNTRGDLLHAEAIIEFGGGAATSGEKCGAELLGYMRGLSGRNP